MRTVEEILYEAELKQKEREMRSRAVIALERIADVLERSQLEDKDEATQ